MLDWLGALAVSSQSARRLELSLTRATAWTGWALVVAAVVVAPVVWAWWSLAALAPAALGAFGLALATAKRRLIFDSDDGLLRLEHRVLGLRSRWALPLFHLRRVVVARQGRRYVAYVERRAGGKIRLDESVHLASVLEVARAVSSVTELRLVDQASGNAAP